LRVDDGGEAEAGGAETLNDAGRGLGIAGDDDPAHVTDE